MKLSYLSGIGALLLLFLVAPTGAEATLPFTYVETGNTYTYPSSPVRIVDNPGFAFSGTYPDLIDGCTTHSSPLNGEESYDCIHEANNWFWASGCLIVSVLCGGPGEAGVAFSYRLLYFTDSPSSVSVGASDQASNVWEPECVTGYGAPPDPSLPMRIGHDCVRYHYAGTGSEDPTVDLVANPTTIVSGNSSSLSWTSTNATSCTSSDFTTGGATASTGVAVAPTATTTYTITCTNASGESATDTATVGVTAAYPPAPTTLNAVCTAGGSSVTLNWDAVAGATSYDLRLDQLSNNTASCAGGWLCATPPDYSNDAVTGTSRTYSITPGAPYRAWIHSRNSSGSDWSEVTIKDFSCLGTQADLVPTDIQPRQVVAGVSRQYTGTVSNTGGTATPSFTSTVYICPDGDTACQNAVLAQGSTSLFARLSSFFYRIAYAATAETIAMSATTVGANGSGTQTGTKTMANPGQYRMAYCADIPGDAVAESNNTKANNCGTWQLLVVCPSDNTIDGSGNCVPSNPPLSCVVSPTTVSDSGGSVTYTASGGSGAYSWTASDGTTGYGTSATAVRTFAAGATAGSYGMSVTRGTGSANCPNVTKGSICTNPTVNITASKDRVRSGETVTISWDGSGVSATCTVSGPGLSRSLSPSSCTVPAGSADVTISTQSEYTITCGAATDSVIVNVIPDIIEF